MHDSDFAVISNPLLASFIVNSVNEAEIKFVTSLESISFMLVSSVLVSNSKNKEIMTIVSLHISLSACVTSPLWLEVPAWTT